MKRITLILLLFISFTSKADDSTVNALLRHIASLQTTQDDFFIPGIFPSYISKQAKFSERKKDNDIFFTALIAYTLKDLRPKLSEENKIIVDSILQRSRPVYPKFKNKKGRNTYNFWRRDTTQRFPYSKLLGAVNKDYDLPDDLDDTVLSLMALDADSAEAEQVHMLMQSFVNSDVMPVRTAIKAYRKYGAYSTWFGKKFPVVFDAAVLCNVLAFVNHHNLLWTPADSASLQLIVYTINHRHHYFDAMYASPYYGSPSVILYHLARLMDVKPIPELGALKPQLIHDALEQYNNTTDRVEQVLLRTTLIKLGYTGDFPLHQYSAAEVEKADLPFFVGNIPAYFRKPSRMLFTENSWLMYYHYCSAYNDVLLLEYQVLLGK